MKIRLIGPLVCLVALLSGTAAASEAVMVENEPGRLFSANGDAITFQTMLDEAVSRDFVLVGEIHPAAAHHAFQARVVEGLAERGRRPVVVLEMLPEAAQPALDRWIDGKIEPSALDGALGWTERGWPDFEIYRPIFDVARNHRLPMVAAALEREEIMAFGTNGEAAVEPARRKRLMLDRPLEGAGLDVLRRTIVDSHCGMVDESSAGPMVLIQRARDGAMARAMIDAGEGGAVLIAGSGHVRRDHGVPRLLPAGSSYAIGQFEADTFPAEDSAVFDAFHLTEAVDRGDPCAEIRARMKHASDAAESSGPK